MLVRVLERGGHVVKVGDRFCQWHRAACHPGAQALSGNERHHIEGEPARRGARAQHGDDVRRLECGGEPDLPREALDGELLAQLGREHLHHDVATELLVSRHEHARHPAASELTRDAVRGAQRRVDLLAEYVAHGG